MDSGPLRAQATLSPPPSCRHPHGTAQPANAPQPLVQAGSTGLRARRQAGARHCERGSVPPGRRREEGPRLARPSLAHVKTRREVTVIVRGGLTGFRHKLIVLQIGGN